MYVIRITGQSTENRNYNFGNSKPCCECNIFLKKFFPGKIIYYDKDGFIIDRVVNIISTHLSFYQKEIRGITNDSSNNEKEDKNKHKT